MRLAKTRIALLMAMISLIVIPSFAQSGETAVDLVQQNPLLDAAFSMLERDNPILDAYNRITGAAVEPRFEYGLPFFNGGTHDYVQAGEPLLFSRAPEYAKCSSKEKNRFYVKGKEYLYGLDGAGFTQWIYSEAGWPEHDELSAMINQYGKYERRNHVYSHRRGKEMPPYRKLAATLQLGDLLVVKGEERHVMMFIGTLRDYGYTAETAPELAAYLDYTLVIHSAPNPDYGSRMHKYLDEHADDPYYANVNVPNGGVAVSIIGVDPKAAPHQVEDSNVLYSYFDLDGYRLTIWDLDAATSFCWFRINSI